ncbi:MAG: hypothetical protein PHP53_11600 [Prolixibacteraceae bacterium]|jgi:hypothetical protein|nr:hypothetical protein [Prolixibacteraceae bacterium]
MKTNKNLKITKKGIEPLKTDGDSIKNTKLHKDKSSKRRLSIYDDFADENLDELDYKFSDEQFDDE